MSASNPLSNIPPLGTPSGMMPPGGPGKFKQIDPLRVIRTHILLLIAAAIVGAVLGGGAWYALDKYMARYTSMATLQVSGGMRDPESPTGETPAILRELEPKILTEVNTIRSQQILDNLLQQPAIESTQWYGQFNGNLTDARKDLDEEIIDSGHIRNTTLIRISATTANPQDAQTVVRELVTVYMREVESRAESRYNKDRVAFQRQLEAVEAQIQTVEAQIRRHLIEHPRASTNERYDVTTQELLFLNSKRSEIAELLTGAQASYNQLLQRLESGDFEPSDDEVAQINRSIPIQQLDSQIRQLRVQRQSQLDRGLGESHEILQQIDSQIRNLEKERQLEFDNQARTIFNARVEVGAQAVAIYQEQLNSFAPRMAELQAQLEDLQRAITDFDTMQREQERLERQREEARKVIQDLDVLIRRAGNITVERRSPATTSEKTFPPKWYVMIPGITLLIFGLVTGLVFLRELLDQRVMAAADIKSITDTALLGIIPDARQDPSGNAPAERIVQLQPSGLLAESYRQVRSAVLSKMDRRGYKTLAVAAAKPKAGTSSVVQNLGTSMALAGRRVLIIDTNFRRPSQAKIAGVAERPGLVELLRGDFHGAAAEGIHTQDQLTLSVLPAGDSSGAEPELLDGPAFRDLLARLESGYDIILIDTPPSLLTSEAQLMCKHVDAMMLVARARTDTRGMIQRLIGQLDGQRADILGVVLNGVQAAAGGYLRQNFQEFHGYSRDAAGKDKPARANRGKPKPTTNGAGPTAPDNGHDPSDETVIVDALQDRNDADELDDLDDLDAFDEERS